MSVFEVHGGNDRRSMIKRYERKSKQDAIRELVDMVHCNWSQIEQLEAQLAAAQLSVSVVTEAQHWEKSLRDAWPVDADDAQGAWAVGAIDEGESYPVLTVDADQYDAPGDSEKIARALITLWSQAFSTNATRTSPTPEGYELVPIYPTTEMVRAAEEAYMPFGDMELAVRLAILSAPAIAAAPPVQQEEPLYITHRPLIRNAINLLGIRRPVAPDVARVIEGLEAMLEGAPTPAHSADEHWLDVARVAEAQELEQQSEGAA